MVDSDVEIAIAGLRLSNWVTVRIHRAAQAIPNAFECGFTGTPSTPYPYVAEGSPCQVFAGGDLVVTGYVDQVVQACDAEGHRFTLAGRGKCSDLVDCSAEWPTSMIQQTDVGDVATKLCQPYGIDVSIRADILSSQASDAASAEALKLPAMGVTLIETPATLLTEMARYYGVLMYESEAGELVLERVGDTIATGSLVAGVNLEAWSLSRSMAERFSQVVVEAMSVAVLADAGADLSFLASATDPNVMRHRVHRAVSSAPAQGPSFAQREADWEVAKRAGVSATVSATVTGWRDAAGALWTPNTRVSLTIAPAGIVSEGWVISEATLIRDAKGTRTELILMPPDAFSVEPISINPIGRDAAEALPETGS